MGSLNRQSEDGMPKRRNSACKNPEVWQVVRVWSLGQEPKWKKKYAWIWPLWKGRRVRQARASQVGQNSGRKRPHMIWTQFQRVGSPTCKKSFGHLHKVFILGIPLGTVISLVPGQSDSPGKCDRKCYQSTHKSTPSSLTPLGINWSITACHCCFSWTQSSLHVQKPQKW